MGIFRTFILVVVASWFCCAPALADKRVALVIGNSDYKNVPRLINPANDATMVAAMLRSAGFDSVTTRLNLGVLEMRKSLREFNAQTRDADVAVIFYAGHGIEMDGNNYLIPTDATLEADTDVFDETFPLDRLLFAVEPAKGLRLVMLDACRDNPFAKTMKRTIVSRGIGRGLARIEPVSPNTMIAFAAKAGSTALDGDAKNSPFASAIVEYLPKPGLDLRKAFGFVRDDVLKNTGYRQEPYVYGSLGGDDVSLVPSRTPAAGPRPDPQDAVRRDYEFALHLGTRDGWKAFLAEHPEGFYSNLAKGELSKIVAVEAQAAAAERARVAEQEKVRLAAAGARQAEQERAAAEAKAAEENRIAAETTKQIESEKAAAAERDRVAAEKAALEKQLAEQTAGAERAKQIEATKDGDKPAAETSAAGQTNDGQRLAALPPPSDATKPALSSAELTRLVQVELRRVGCLTATADGDWNAVSHRSLMLFNRYTGSKFDVKLASIDMLDAIRAKPSRVCPLVCDHGFRADGDACVKITCRAGYRLNDNNECGKTRERKSLAAREDAEPAVGTEPTQNDPALPKSLDQGNRTAPRQLRGDSCSKHFNECVRIRTNIQGPYGSCEQRLLTCRRTGGWTDRFGHVFLMGH